MNDQHYFTVPAENPADTTGWAFDSALAELLRSATDEMTRSGVDGAPVIPVVAADTITPGRHRRRRQRPEPAKRPTAVRWLRWTSLLLAAVVAIIVALLSALGGVMSYDPLREAASGQVSPSLTAWWPLLIYGPWLAASLSILRAALHQRRALHAWAILVFFSGLAVSLCVLRAPTTVTDLAAAGLPPISALAAFHQLVRQITLVSPPRHAVPPQRQASHHS